jgi:hypothetical protein
MSKAAIVCAACIILFAVGAFAYYVWQQSQLSADLTTEILGDNGKRPAEYIGLQKGVQYINIKKHFTLEETNEPFITSIMSVVLYDSNQSPIVIHALSVTISGFHADGRNVHVQRIVFDAAQEPVPIIIDAELIKQLAMIDIEYDMGHVYEVSKIMMRTGDTQLTGCSYTIGGPDDPHIFSGQLGPTNEHILFQAKRMSGFCGSCLSAY